MTAPVSITLTFASAALAAAALARMEGVTVAASTSVISPSANSNPPAQTPSLPVITDFDKELLPLVQAASKKSQADFGKLMQGFGFKNINDVKSASDKWGHLADACKKIIG